MEAGGVFLALLGAVVLFAADWQNLPVVWLAVLLFVFAALVGFTVRRWRFPLILLLSLSPVGAEWSSEHLKFFRTELSVVSPNLITLAVVGFVLAYTASLMGGGVRSMLDAGTR
ncbi:MAG TPA: hypothetical protein VFU86_22600 [Terriglobales bacterium]|nr:hypothetical protein [Terriglobales bacterium]